MNPNNLSLAELSFYGAQSDDPWVNRLATALGVFLGEYGDERIPVHEDEVVLYFEDRDQELRDLKYEIDELELDNRDKSKTIHALESKINKLKYDLDHTLRTDMQHVEIEHLKAEVYRCKVKKKADDAHLDTVISELEGLKKRYDELKNKYDTWNVLSN